MTATVPSTHDTTRLPTSEVFGPTYQGEGPHTGRRCYFVRLGLCNLSCEWCDTPFTWDHTRYDLKAENPERSVRWIHDQLRDLGWEAQDVVVLSGGEPLMHHQKLGELFRLPAEWHVETNGTIQPPDWWPLAVTHTTVSPKVATNDPHNKRLKPRALTQWASHARAGRAAWKFVCRDTTDVDTAVNLAAAYDVPRNATWIMPEGTTPADVVGTHRRIVDAALQARVNTTTRMHTLLWGEERGH